ncbi:trans-sulfuration enzyme family protein [Shewanella putrefaciens]|uniref:PLP-dependent aspartate aminotransferase family protein n=1 Tax=Shewanella putrefaciens TaxID=24 RepID=A0ABX8XCS8_SHEPU|nr:PLP-dependent aspartate aminotransferase family protein [Shewanella putrefaciens]AVV83838.1 methionine gamma-lyase [Shewanella putrefaciens]MCT8943528.1 PLP-dependent aspartate aminotransferase family protein [Shewanella putrefaciens]QSE49994.1 PLP-dependent transferase [Shewanella putrefaciens]QYX73404.1 PLP-dependent aspartate aminotransferase family protein [Shewanella putrefaciens]
MQFKTKLLHTHYAADNSTGALTTPIYQSSTFAYGSAEDGRARFAGEQPGFIYSRMANPTVQALEYQLAQLEGADEALVVASGMAAISSIFYALASQGDEIAFIDPVYGGTAAFLIQTLTRAGITVRRYQDDDHLLAEITAETKIILFEPITNPTLKVSDYRKVKLAAEKVGAITICDNTFLTPYLFKPLEHGIDIVMHSATKYLSGHGDLIAGVVAGPKALMQPIRTIALKHIGAAIGPQEAYLLQRGLRTLALRMDAHLAGAAKVAAFLATHPSVTKVYYPGLAEDQGHQVLSETINAFGGMVSIELEGGFNRAAQFLDHLNLFTQAVSLGDLESLACHPASTTHAAMDAASRLASGVNDNLIRLSIGVEDPQDLIADLEQALVF